MKKRIAACLAALLLLLTAFLSCADEGDKVTRQIVSAGVFESEFGDVLTFREDGTFDLARADKTVLADVAGGAFRLETSGAYTYKGNWGRQGKVRYFIYRLEGAGFFAASGEDGYWYRLFGGEDPPGETEIRDGLAGVRYKPAPAK